MGQPADAPLTPKAAREVCERTAGAVVLEGSIASLGSQYVLGLRAKNCRTGEVLAEEQVQAARKEDVLNALSQIASKFRTRVGESLSTVERYDTPLAEATTPSIDALKVYSTAVKVQDSTGPGAALPLFKRAIEIDRQFAMAYAGLGNAYGILGESDLSAETMRTAYQMRDRASDSEKFFIAAIYDFRVTGDLEKVQQTCEQWVQAYPRDMTPHLLLGTVYQVTGKHEKMVQDGKITIQLDPESFAGYSNLADGYLLLGRLGEAESAMQRAFEHKAEDPLFLYLRYDIAFLRADQAGMQRQVALSEGKPGDEDLMVDREAFTLAYGGHLQQAWSMTRRAADVAQQASQKESAALYETGAAVREALYGNAPEAKRSAMAALALSKDREVEYGAAFALALARELSQAQTLANDLEKRFGEDTSVRYAYLPELRALFALHQGEASKAIELLQTAMPYQLGTPRSTIHGFFGALYPVYVRGEAYLAAHQGAEAATEFQKILDHRGIVVSDPIGALAHLQLGRALALSGDKAKAVTAYQDFLSLWRDADQDIPILKQAKAEFAKL
jgi:eukaryotic-like serine/threonine-protein kinase